MGATDQIDVMLLVKLVDDLLSEGEADTTIVVAIGLNAALGVRPQQITQQSRVRNVRWTHDILDLVQILKFRGEATVHAENFLVNQSSNGQAIENIAENAPESDRVTTFAFVIKSVDAIDLGTLVIAS